MPPQLAHQLRMQHYSRLGVRKSVSKCRSDVVGRALNKSKLAGEKDEQHDENARRSVAATATVWEWAG